VIRTSKDLFEGMVTGRVNAMAGALRGVVSLEGDPTLLVLFQRALPGPPAPAKTRVDREGWTIVSDGIVKILDGNTFVVSDPRGDIEASLTDPTGLFSFDTRFLSTWVLTVNGERLNALSVDDLQYFEARFFLVPGTGTVYVDAKLSVIRQRAVGDGFHEELTILNHAEEPIELTVRVDADSDFADLFEVKDALKKKGTYSNRIDEDGLHLVYERETFARMTTISASAPAAIDEKGLTFVVTIEPHGSWTTDLDVVTAAGAGGRLTRPKYRRGERRAQPNMGRSLENWLEEAPRLESEDDRLRATYRRSWWTWQRSASRRWSRGDGAFPPPGSRGS
jgi:glycogen debranching enzyme